MGKVKAAPQFSESISSFCKLMENAQRDYAWNYDEVNRMDRLTQDYLHKLELDGLDYKERAKVATQLAKCRQARRECKDTFSVLKQIIWKVNFFFQQHLTAGFYRTSAVG